MTGRRTDIPGPVLKLQVIGGLPLNSRVAGHVIRMAWRRRTVPKIRPNISTLLEIISEYSEKSNILEVIFEILRPVPIFLDGEA